MFENGYNWENHILVSTKKGYVTEHVFGLWLTEVFVPAVDERRAALRQQLATFDEKAVLIMDGCKAHKIEPFRELLAQKNIIVVFLVPHSSHVSQALDVGIFGWLKSITRDEASYVVRLDALDEAFPNEEEEPEPVRAERVKVFADYITAILNAYERAASRKRIVSAFRQVGILYDIPDPHHPERLFTCVDPAHGRAVNQYLGLFQGTRPLP